MDMTLQLDQLSLRNRLPWRRQVQRESVSSQAEHGIPSNETRGFTSALVVTPLADGKTWVLMHRFCYHIGRKDSLDMIHVEAGFMTDFASIPRPFWAVLPTWGKYGNAAVVHDWLYWKQDRSRKAADRIMLEAMDSLSVPKWQRYAIYWAVRVFGWLAWKRNAWDRADGVQRVQSEQNLKAVRRSERPGLLRQIWRHSIKPAYTSPQPA